MERTINEQPEEYGLIRAIPGTAEEMQTELERHSQVLAENKDATTYDGWNRVAFARANLNQLLDGELSPDALTEVQKAMGSFATSATV
jgi:hypothetical protein